MCWLRLCVWSGMALGIGALAGCSSAGPSKVVPDKSVPVTGVVNLDGKPLGNARVTFYPQEVEQGSGVASGFTDSAGKYELQSLFGDKKVIGAAPGKYKVTISVMVRPDGSPLPPDSQEPPINSGARESIAIEHSAFDRTELSASVSSTGGTYNFDVKKLQ